MRISRSVLNLLVDALLLVLFCAICFVAVVLRFILPVPSAGQRWYLWGVSDLGWHALQFGLVCALALGVLIHVMLHWNWVCGVTRAQLLGRKGEGRAKTEVLNTLIGVAVLIGVLNVIGLAVAAASLSLQGPFSV